MARLTRKPHILFLLANQLRSDVLDAFGDQQCPTPKIDLLCQHATVFLRHFTTCPLGGPSRASLATGLFPQRHGARINGAASTAGSHAMIRARVPLIHEHLRDAGYRVVHVGVQNLRTSPDLIARVPDIEFIGPFHLSEHLKHLDDRGLIYGDLEALRDPVLDMIDGKPTVLGGMSARTALFPLREELFYDSVIAENAAGVVRGHSANAHDRPLALLCNFNLPHPPLWAPQHFAEMIEPYSLKLPATTGRWYKSTSPLQLANFPGQMGARLDYDQWRRAWAMYLGMTALLDQCIGQVLTSLDQAGLLDDCLIVLASDHGDMLGSHRLLGKMCMYEPAIRVPLVIKPPGPFRSTPHRHTWDLGSHVDLTATLLDYAGAAPMPASTGLSMRNPAEGRPNQAPQQEHVFACFDGNAGLAFAQRMIRSRTHKLIHNIGYVPELYDLVEDPRETRNLCRDKQHDKIRNSLRKRLNLWMQSQEDEAPPL